MCPAFALLLLAIAGHIATTLGDAIVYSGSSASQTDVHAHKHAPMLPDDMHPYCDWRFTTHGCLQGWVHEGILGVGLGCYFSLTLAGILLLRRRWRLRATCASYDHVSLSGDSAVHRARARSFPVLRHLLQYTHCTITNGPPSIEQLNTERGGKRAYCAIHGACYCMQLAPSPVDCLLLCWTCFGLLRLVCVTIVLLGAVRDSAVQAALFDASLSPAIIGTAIFLIGLVGHDPPRRLVDCAKINGPQRRWIYRPPIWCLQLLALLHVFCYPAVTLVFSLLAGRQANRFNLRLFQKWDSMAVFAWSIQAWALTMVASLFTAECLRVAYWADAQGLPCAQEDASPTAAASGHAAMNEAEFDHLYRLTRIYGVVAGVGTAVGLWTLMAGLLPPRSFSNRISTPMLSSIALNCCVPILAIIIMFSMYTELLPPTRACDHSPRPWSMRDAPAFPPPMPSSYEQRRSYLVDVASHSSQQLPEDAYARRAGRGSTMHSRRPSNRSRFSSPIADDPPPPPPPPPALHRNGRHASTCPTATEASCYRSSMSSGTRCTLPDGSSNLMGVHGTENQEGRVNTASAYMSPRGSFSSGDGRGYIIEMYSVEESAYIGRDITDSCDSRVFS
ncbi:hypothetical protein SYNPS1DRAFT_27954 [Syncephalis pseudoplumigaleata]|uniref:Uncharacterized protein n=1 Tax=Syncephalis pseudoplumigaleata TaxID=1712513 RepID=A0A4P9Z1Y0_9FUNG|nr:hypothetical protein SYNPS1DRAFT_27954 [Syncephalis pseudoplumigaleata]|eukprot:RKP26348.1 hypothetical protein SYNPS1DRAFT_27954 [Syncephalis pseudoplumigaleata]